jgi:hypothetical protein
MAGDLPAMVLGVPQAPMTVAPAPAGKSGKPTAQNRRIGCHSVRIRLDLLTDSI